MTVKQAAVQPSVEPVDLKFRRRGAGANPPLTPLIDVFLFLIVHGREAEYA
jgi:hypothetical protein